MQIPSSVSQALTQAWADSPLQGWATGQLWAWEGGEALTVVVGYHPHVTTHFIIRLGGTTHFVEAPSIHKALAYLGEGTQRAA